MACNLYFLVERSRKAREARDIRVRVGTRRDGVLAVEEGRSLLIVAGDLAEHVGLSATDCSVRECSVSRIVGAQTIHHDVIAGRILHTQAAAVESLQARQLACYQRFLSLDTRLGAIVDLVLLSAASPGVHSEIRRGHRGYIEILVHELVEQDAQRL